MLSRKKVAVAVLVFVMGVSTAYAILPAFVATWLITGNNLLIADLVVGQVGALAGFLWWDCNGFSLSSQCKSSSANQINADSVSNVMGKKPLQVDIRPQGVRGNPDSSKWNSATGTNRNPTPKGSFALNAGLPAMPSSFPAVVQDMGGAGTKSYYNGNYRRDETVTTAPVAGQSASWSGSVSGLTGTFYVYDKVTLLTCPAGYTNSSGTCNLTDSTSVTKPTSTPCEVLYDSGTQTFNFDAQNPNCSGLESQILTNSGKKISTVSTASTGSEKIEAEPTANGGFSITQYKPDGSWVNAQTGPYSDVNGGYPITGTSSGSAGSTPGGSGSGTGTGGTGGTGSTGTGTGSGGGSCGGSGQVPCAIDGSGLQGQSADLSSALSGVDTANQNVMSGIQSHMPTAPAWGWTLPVQPVSCSPLSWNVLGRAWTINWCPYIPLIQQAISFLAYCFTALYLFQVAFRPARRS